MSVSRISGAHSSIRISVGPANDEEQVDGAAWRMTETVVCALDVSPKQGEKGSTIHENLRRQAVFNGVEQGCDLVCARHGVHVAERRVAPSIECDVRSPCGSTRGSDRREEVFQRPPGGDCTD